MLLITVVTDERYDEENNLFITPKKQVLHLEHSLISLSKWESKWGKAFLSKDSKTYEETIDYIRCMTMNQIVDPEFYSFISAENMEEVQAYIEAPMTATSFSKENTGVSREIITSEIIYYWMITLNIPFDCQKWHLNRLLTLINVCNIKSKKPPKMGRKELANRNTELNAARKKLLNTNG